MKMIKSLFDFFKRKQKKKKDSMQDLYEENKLNMNNLLFNFSHRAKSIIKKFDCVHMVCSGKDRNGDYLQVWHRFLLAGEERENQNLEGFKERVLAKFNSFRFCLEFSGYDSDGDFRSFSFERTGEEGYVAFMCCVEITQREEQIREAILTTETIQ